MDYKSVYVYYNIPILKSHYLWFHQLSDFDHLSADSHECEWMQLFFKIAWYICLYLLLLQSLKTTSSADHMIVITCNNTTINNQHLRKSNIYFVENGCTYKLHYESHIQVFTESLEFFLSNHLHFYTNSYVFLFKGY